MHRRVQDGKAGKMAKAKKRKSPGESGLFMGGNETRAANVGATGFEPATF
ncbi:hypothetical protein [Thermostilla marina]